MFRKPKKKPAALRSGGAGGSSGVGGGAPADPSSSAGKKRRRPRRDSSSDDDDGDKEEDTSDLLQQIRRERDEEKAKKAGGPLLNTSSTGGAAKKKKGEEGSWMHQYKSNDQQLTAKEMATRTAEYHPTENKPLAGGEEGGAVSQNANMAAFQKHKNAFHAGPLRAATFVRTTARFDYQPDICKDYKETGFCGFGDTCIYLHDRGDTKTGWQMEQEYEEKKKREEDKKSKEMERFMNSMMQGGNGKAGDAEENEAAVKTDDGIPFACHICRGPFTNPIVTPCGHYFCEKCMLAKIKEAGPGCPVCQKDTHGVLNHAQKLVAKKRRLVGREGTWEEYLEKSKGGGDGEE